MHAGVFISMKTKRTLIIDQVNYKHMHVHVKCSLSSLFYILIIILNNNKNARIYV
jgi:hypothetical protein